MKPEDFRFLDRLRVRWAEVDMQKVVFNGHYLMYFDTAVAGYWRALAAPVQQTMEALHGDIFVRKATLDYAGSARYDDVCDIGIRCARIGTSSMVFEAALFRGATRLVSGELVYVFADPLAQTSKPVPPALRAVLMAFEAGEPMVDVRVGRWRQLREGAEAVRRAVAPALGGDAATPARVAHADLGAADDADDELALHAVACNRFGAALGAGRLLRRADGTAQIDRLAVVPTLRHSGIGRQLLDALLGAWRSGAAGAGARPPLLVLAPSAAAGFFVRAGFIADGTLPAGGDGGEVPLRLSR